MSGTVTLVLNHVAGKSGTVSSIINTSVSVKNSDTGATIRGTISAAGNFATMFPGKLAGPVGGFVVTMTNLSKNGFDGSTLAVGDILTIGAGVAALVNAPLVGFALGVAGLGWTIYSVMNPEADVTVSELFNRAKSWFQPPRRDPLTLDLDGDGLETMGIDTGRLVYFDHDNDGVKT